MACRLALAHPDGLDENLVEAGGLAEYDGLTRLARHAAQRARRRAGTDEGVGVRAEFLHARLVAQDAALRALTAGVDGQYGQLAAVLTKHMHAELVDAGRLACPRHAADADAHRATAVGQAAVDDLLGLLLVGGVDALDERDGLREDGDVATRNAFDHLADRQFTAAHALPAQVGINDCWLLDAAIDLQAGIFWTVFWMLHYNFYF